MSYGQRLKTYSLAEAAKSAPGRSLGISRDLRLEASHWGRMQVIVSG